MNGWLEQAGEIIWGPWTAALVAGVGIWLSFRTGWVQLLGAKRWWRATVSTIFSRQSRPDGISPFQSATAALAGSLGTGNIVGVAVAISAGGPGAILWMWAAAIPGMAIAYSENVLGIRWRKRGSAGKWTGGPMTYMRRGLGWRYTPVIWALFCAGAALCIGNVVQVNSIASAVRNAWGIPPYASGLIIAAAAAPAILGGTRSVTRLTEHLVPCMAVIYTLSCTAVILINIRNLPDAFVSIIAEAFSPKSACGGMLGVMLVGLRRGIFTNEAGMGTSVLIHCTAEVSIPEEQGYWSIFEVFVDTILMCTLTALAILVSGAHLRAEGAAMSAEMFRQLFGRFSSGFSATFILLFAFATVVGWSCCGERSFAYVFGEPATLWYRILYAAMIIPGCILSADAVWAVSDILNALLMIPNLIAVTLLCREETSKDYIGTRINRRTKIPAAK